MLVDTENQYLDQIYNTLPRLMALFDTDLSSKSYGMGDRYFWAWGLIDFGNGTFQGASHGLSRLWRHGLWPYATSKEYFIKKIDAMFVGAENLTRPDGSLEEAFPNEGSFCVTALVAFDLLNTLDLLNEDIDVTTKERWQAIVQPLIGYLLKTDETHAIISNHLATAVAALVRWHFLTQELIVEKRAQQLLEVMLSHQSAEGWFKEYEGADPGYQSLCTYYLADVHSVRPDWHLLEPLRKSIQFLWHFAHPDGSFGGIYGSRCTRFYYPAGILALATEIDEAASLAAFMANSIAKQCVVSLQAMDEPNLIPMFNSYCWAATLAKKIDSSHMIATLELPALLTGSYRKYYKQAGLIIDRGQRHYSVISIHKGGVVSHFVDKKQFVYDTGVVVKNNKGLLGSTQTYSSSNSIEWVDDQTLILESSISEMPKQLPNPWKFLALRLLCVSVFRIAPLREWVKQQLVRLLITGTKFWPVQNQRLIKLGMELSIEDKLTLPNGYKQVNDNNVFIPIHMASQGYWQVQDEEQS